MSTPMRRLRAARAASWPDPEASIRDALEFMLGADDDLPFHQQAQNLIASIDVCCGWQAADATRVSSDTSMISGGCAARLASCLAASSREA